MANTRTDRHAPLTTLLVLANIVVYLISIQHGGDFFGGPAAHTLHSFAATPARLAHTDSPRTLVTAITSIFLHASLPHLLGDLLFLLVFGPSLEHAVGAFVLLGLYLLGGIAGVGLEVALDPGSHAVTVAPASAIGAVVAGYAVAFPRARVLALIVLVVVWMVSEVPLVLVLALWVALQFVFGLTHLNVPLGPVPPAAYVAPLTGLILGPLARGLATAR
jgi:membrane associated rhomboid family serine protease